MKYKMSFLLTVFSILCVGCGGGGGGSAASTAPAPVGIAVTTVSVSGHAEWVGATTVSVLVDDVAVPVIDGIWTTDVDLSEVTDKVLDLKFIVDGITEEHRQMTVSR